MIEDNEGYLNQEYCQSQFLMEQRHHFLQFQNLKVNEKGRKKEQSQTGIPRNTFLSKFPVEKNENNKIITRERNNRHIP
jgi:hypothetical protein